MFEIRSVIGLRVNDKIAFGLSFSEIVLSHSCDRVFAGWSASVEFQVADSAVIVDTPGTASATLKCNLIFLYFTFSLNLYIEF